MSSPYETRKNIDTTDAMALRSPTTIVKTAITPVSITARRGLPVPASTAANGPNPLNSRSLASACRIRGAPRNDASADDRVADSTPAPMSHGTLATRAIAS
mgnify:CR=1 FL=1